MGKYLREITIELSLDSQRYLWLRKRLKNTTSQVSIFVVCIEGVWVIENSIYELFSKKYFLISVKGSFHFRNMLTSNFVSFVVFKNQIFSFCFWYTCIFRKYFLKWNLKPCPILRYIVLFFPLNWAWENFTNSKSVLSEYSFFLIYTMLGNWNTSKCFFS